ncbi:MAG TPA: beta-ketoacyl-[acyl-carrier-protein] synthase II [Anaerolineae bacterium]|nr:beta-ketoacyl-[acyl-carrier-protein] synthase II [Anaerolineae bacterium]
MSRIRVVVTGVGAITPLALTAEETWRGLLAGRSGIGPITQFDASGFSSRIAGEVKDFDPRAYIPFKEARRMSRASQFAVVAAQQALADAGLKPPLGEEAGVLLGTGVGGMEWAFAQARILWEKGLARVSPFGITAALPNMPAHHVSRWAQALGPISTVVAACASGTQAVGEGTEVIRRGAAEVMVAGGVEGFVHEISVGGFCVMRALSTRNDEPERASRPFDAGRDGFVFAEGCGLLVLESLEHARARGARILAEMLGYASSSDGFHVAQPDPDGRGAMRAMAWALEDAGVEPDRVDYINAHGTGTPINDLIETRAIKGVFGTHAYAVPISSTKSMIGHAMGAAGGIEAVVCVLTLRDQVIHPTVNLEEPDPECDLDYVPGAARRADVRVVLCNSFGLGGQNACLVLGKFEG